MNQKELNEILELHKKWLNNDGGKRADFTDANLTGVRLADANLSHADLTDAILTDADLTYANLTGANLSNCIGNSKNIKTLFIFDEYNISYTKDSLQIGCQNHRIENWFGFNDNRILEMDGKKALKFWRKNKENIRSIIKNNPAD